MCALVPFVTVDLLDASSRSFTLGFRQKIVIRCREASGDDGEEREFGTSIDQ